MLRSSGCLVMILALIAPPSAAARSHVPGPRPLEVACAKKRGGVLRYVRSAARCDRRSERAIDFAEDGPIEVCISRGALRRASLAHGCGRGRRVVLPADGPRSFCVHGRRQLLRMPRSRARCRGRSELEVILAGRTPATAKPGPAGNTAPTATADAATVDEDHATTIAATANDSDPEGDPVHVSRVDGTAAAGAVAIEPDGALRYDPAGRFDALAAGATATDTFAYQAGDGSADSGAAIVTVTVTGVNDAPALGGLESDALAYESGAGPAAVTGSLSLSDVDGATLSWAAVTITGGHAVAHDALSFTDGHGIAGSYDAASGTLTLAGRASVAEYEAALRSVAFSADAGAAGGSRTISFQVDDDGPVNHASPLVTRAVAVTHVNHAPAALDDALATDEDSAVASIDVLGNDSDADLDGLRASAIDAAGTVGEVTLGNGTIAYNPAGRFDALAEGATATDAFRYRAADPSDAGSELATVTVTVTGVDDAPVVSQADAALAYPSDQGATALAPELTITDVDSATLSGATVQLGAGYVGGRDVLSFAGTGSISGSWDAATGTLTLTGADTVAAYEVALRAVTFRGDNADAVRNAFRSVSFQVSDGVLTSSQAFRTIDVTHVNQAPTARADAFGGAVGNTALAVSTSPHRPHTTISGTVLANDADPETAHAALTATASSPTPSGATVTMNADGAFTYVPPQGFTGDDSFRYTVHDNDAPDPRSADGTITVTVAGPMTWYVDAGAAPGGDGRSDAPFSTLAPLSSGGGADAKDGPGDRIFVYGSTSSYPGGIVLEASQKLLGEPRGLTAGATTLVPAAGNNPVVSAGGAPAVTLAGGADVQRVDMTASGAPAVSGTNVGAATIGAQTAITGTGGGVALDGGAGTVTIGSAITTTGGHSVSVQNRTGGAVSFLGAVNDTGTGIELRANTGASVGFSGRIVAGTGASPAFSASGGGTVTATGPASTLASTTGTALEIRNDAIGFAGLTFQSISADGAPNGIVLSGTGGAGGLVVTGTGAPNSGGTIRSATGHAISLSDTAGVSLNDILVQDPAHAGIKGAGVHGFSLTNSTITGAGTAASDPADAAVAFNGGASDLNVDRALTITGNTLANAYGGGLDVANRDGTITGATVMNNAVSSTPSATTSKGGGIVFRLSGTPATVASLTRATIALNTVTNVPSADGIAVRGGNTSGAAAPVGTYGVPSGSTPGAGASMIDISSNTVAGDPDSRLNGTGITASVTGRGQGNFSIRSNGTTDAPLRNMRAEGIATGAAGDVTANFDVSSNHVDAGNVLGASAISLVTDTNVQADSATLATPVVNARYLANVTRHSSGPGLRVLARDSNGTTRVRFAGNTVSDVIQGATPGLRVDAGSSGSAAYDPTVCTDLENNDAGTGPPDAAGDVAPGILLYKRSDVSTAYRFGLGTLGMDADAATAESSVDAFNAGSALSTAGPFSGKRAAVAAGDQFSGCTLPF